MERLRQFCNDLGELLQHPSTAQFRRVVGNRLGPLHALALGIEHGGYAHQMGVVQVVQRTVQLLPHPDEGVHRFRLSLCKPQPVTLGQTLEDLFDFAGDAEGALRRDAGLAYTVRSVLSDAAKGGKPKLRCSLVDVLGHATG